MNKPLRRTLLFSGAVAALTLLVSILRAFALITALDVELGYFKSGAVLPTAIYIMEAFVLIGILAPLRLLARGTLPCERTTPSLPALVATGITALAALGVSVVLFARLGTLGNSAALGVLAALLMLAALAFFARPFLMERPGPNGTLLWGYATLVALALLLALTYFDLYTQMNAPHKVSLHIALLSAMFYLVLELRFVVGRPLPRASLCASAGCLFLCGAVGLSNVIAFLAGVYDNALYLVLDLFLVAIAATAGTGMADRCRALRTTEVPAEKE